jgi:uncharacterized protein
MSKLRITLLASGADTESEYRFADGATIADALAVFAREIPAGGSVGIWGKVRPLDTVLRDRDRVEIYEPLRADPKTARRGKVSRPRGGKIGKM